MSSLTVSEYTLRQAYRDSYSWIRQYRNDQWGSWPPMLMIPDPEIFRVFCQALTSHDHKLAGLSGWRNFQRERQFRDGRPVRDRWADIPF